MSIYAIGDIHGQLEMLEGALAKIEADGGQTGPGGADEVIFLGDLVDRGPHSREVIERVRAGIAEGQNWTAIRGNHDDMFRKFLTGGVVWHEEIKSDLAWTHRRLGGLATMQSYGVDVAEGRPLSEIWAEARALVPAAHREFLNETPFWAERGKVLFVHAGIRPDVPLEEQTISDLTWIRGPGFEDYTRPHPWLVVHGHTIMERPMHFGNRINLDTGAGANAGPRFLTVAAFEGEECFVLTDAGRMPLRPAT
jgi:serine/threonine protein phosphatase 1